MRTYLSSVFNTMKSITREAWIWVIALLVLACINPHSENLVSFCPLHYFGFEFCPGCGLGKSISHLLHGDPVTSFKTHPLGIFAFIILLTRIITLTKKSIQRHGQNY